jgi:hypothetical protein
MKALLHQWPRGHLMWSLGFTYIKTIFRGVLNNCPTYFLSFYYYLFSNICILKPPYVNYNPLFQIITYPIF